MASLRGIDTRRRHHRFERPVLVVDDRGRSGRTRNWSIGGALVDFDSPPAGSPGEETDIQLQYGPQSRGSFRARLVRVGKNGRGAAYQFTRINDDGVSLATEVFKDMAKESYEVLLRRMAQ